MVLLLEMPFKASAGIPANPFASKKSILQSILPFLFKNFTKSPFKPNADTSLSKKFIDYDPSHALDDYLFKTLDWLDKEIKK